MHVILLYILKLYLFIYVFGGLHEVSPQYLNRNKAESFTVPLEHLDCVLKPFY